MQSVRRKGSEALDGVAGRYVHCEGVAPVDANEEVPPIARRTGKRPNGFAGGRQRRAVAGLEGELEPALRP